jgi:outer membrane protein insertion porin family
MKSKIKYYCAILLASTMLTGIQAFAEKVRDIEISGNERIEKETIINYLSLKKGQEYSADKENSSIIELYSTLLFDNISLKFFN